MANRPKRRNKIATPEESPEIEAPTLSSSEEVAPVRKKKTYRNKPKKKKPFVDYLSIKKYKPKGLDTHYGR
tara:strand:+ start:179 stop:391 length:213 start_codon:yes stop_codon:yes gene_type:complete